ncbi:MAG: hypothetical protein AABX88_00400 [Nanoarchaeota archaeon]
MRLTILPYRKAIIYEPQVKTLALRIFSSSHKNKEKRKLVNSELYQKISEYYFDDLFVNDSPNELFSGDLARRMLNDVEKSINSCEEILIHCVLGKSRSPAVGIALNEIYNLGDDSQKLKNQFPNFNERVYQILIQENIKTLLT